MEGKQVIFNFCPECGGKCNKTGAKRFDCQVCQKSWFDQPEAAVAAIIRNRNGEILFIKRKLDPAKGTWSVPGGFVDNYEPLETALKREVNEEAGVNIHHIRYFESLTNDYVFKDYTFPIVIAVFTAESEDPGKTNDQKEVAEVFWVKPTAVDPEKIGLPDVKQAMMDYLKKYLNPGQDQAVDNFLPGTESNI
jgi:NAD+ diphosphatase